MFCGGRNAFSLNPEAGGDEAGECATGGVAAPDEFSIFAVEKKEQFLATFTVCSFAKTKTKGMERLR